ncbi:hypothetical protein [Nonomuraea basaltis]|uniref:hypothetical protein n=1 Tax=Nonomuraea basaltis TaxID=2495887 RepID=UPI00110C540A|nr:hypothetical protein [Nonomuraea basaltis]TMR95586.1 hypothetical protein EJK15_27915 [Nonomuraea basaltis]
MSKILNTQNAEITTVTVEVKTITISRKQVTLSVFRQLREEPILSKDLTLNGVPWGYVNYHPAKCGDEGEHLHVVWQKGNDLLRSRINAPANANLEVAPWVQLVLSAAIAEGLQTKLAGVADPAEKFGFSDVTIVRNYHKPGYGWFTYGGVRFHARMIAEQFAAVYTRDKHPASIREAGMQITGPNSDASAIAALKLPVSEYHAVWDALSALPHLFIAV